MFKSFLIWVLFSIGQMLGMSFGVDRIRRKHADTFYLIGSSHDVISTPSALFVMYTPRWILFLFNSDRLYVCIHESVDSHGASLHYMIHKKPEILFGDVCLCKTIHVTARLYAHGRKQQQSSGRRNNSTETGIYKKGKDKILRGGM